MRATVYYLIAPKRELLEKAMGGKVSGLSEFVLPIIWTGEEADKGDLRGSELELLTKILYSGAICNLQLNVPESKSIFGEATATTEFFDRNWTIQRVPHDMTLGMALSDICVTGVIKKIPLTGNAVVDEFIARYANA